MQYFITILFYLTIQTASLAAPVKNFTAQYDLYYNKMYIGKTTRHLVKKDNLLTFSSISKTDGIAAWFKDITIAETSKLRYKDNRLTFYSYNYDEKKNDEKKVYKLHLDKNKTIYNSHTNEHYPIANDLHDMLGFTVAVMQDMQNGKKELKYTIAEKSKIKTYTLKFIKKEKIATNSGHIVTLKMEHYNPQTKERFTLWCAEDMGFLPVRILSNNRKGNKSLLNLTQFNQKKLYLELDEDESE
jgi:hypothetical protein